MNYKMAAYRTLIVLLCTVVIFSEAKNSEGEGVCPALGYWNLKLPNTSIPSALLKAICPHIIVDHQFDIPPSVGDISISSQKYITPQVGDISISPRGGDVTISSHEYLVPKVGDKSIPSYKYIPSQGGDATIYSHEYLIPEVGHRSIPFYKDFSSQGGDVSIYSHEYVTPQIEDIPISSHKYIPSQGGDTTLYSHEYNQAKYRNPLHQREYVTLYNRKYLIDRDSSTQEGDIILNSNQNQGNIEYHRQLLMGDPLLSIFFFEKDLHIQTNLMVHLEALRTHVSAGFIPRSMADKIPFSLEKLHIAQDMLNIPQGSHLTVIMEKTLKKCESPAVIGETTFCATSLESMIDYITTKFGSKISNVLATDLPSNFKYETDQYSIAAMFSQSNSTSKNVICHNLIYPYAIYLCHEAKGTKIFELSLKGQGTYGDSIPVVAICHEDTSGWNPDHAAFVALNVKPGEEGICHFMLEGTIAWLITN